MTDPPQVAPTARPAAPRRAEGPAGRPSAIQSADPRSATEAVLFEMRRVIVGQDAMLERVLVALLSGGHLLLEGVPGLAKTLTIKTLAQVARRHFRRVQFTPGPRPRRPRRHPYLPPRRRLLRHRARPGLRQLPARRRDQPRPGQGPVRAARGHAGAPGHDRPREPTRVPSPFLVLATQNPIESEGTYPLPEAQVDRFMFKVLVDYPSSTRSSTSSSARSRPAADGPRPCSTPSASLELQAARRGLRRPARHRLRRRARAATREPGASAWATSQPYIDFGASPRGSINLVHAARALALPARPQLRPADRRRTSSP